MCMHIATQQRETKYCHAVRQHIKQLGHATNLELLEIMQKEYPSLSPTTVHRVTSRLVKRGELQLAPSTPDGSMRFDSNLALHDHFQCRKCGMIRDAQFPSHIIREVESEFKDCVISGPIVITGLCKICSKEGGEK